MNAREVPESPGANTVRGLGIFFFVLAAAGIVFGLWAVWMETNF